MQTCLNVITQHALIERAKRRIQIISSAFQNECKNAASRHEIADGTNAGCCFLTCSDMACFASDALTISLPFEYFVEICNLSWYLMSSSVNAIYGPVRWTFSSLRLCYSFPCISKAERVRNCIVMWNHVWLPAGPAEPTSLCSSLPPVFCTFLCEQSNQTVKPTSQPKIS